MCYEEVFGHYRYNFVQKKLGWHMIVNDLTSEFFNRTSLFLKQNLKDFDVSANAWYESLRRVFTTALDLDGNLMLWRTEIRIIWPQFDEPIDLNFMAVNTDTGQGEKVRATIFPAVIEKDADEGDLGAENVIIRAMVLSQ